MKLSELIETSDDPDIIDCAKTLIEKHPLFDENTNDVYFDAYWRVDLNMDCYKCQFFDECEVTRRNE